MSGSSSATKGGEEITLLVDGKEYGGWISVRISRAIDRMASDFDISVTEKWDGRKELWQIQPFTPCQVLIGGEPVLTGYVDGYFPAYEAHSHQVRINGRSKTQDIIDCTPDLPGGQFSGYTLEQIARAVAAPFGIEVVVQTAAGATFPDATIQRHETGFQFLERLARLRSILLCDDELGRLVLTTAGSERTSGALRHGENILRASAHLSGAARFSVYRVKTSMGVQAVNHDIKSTNTPEPSQPEPAESAAAYHARVDAYADEHDAPQTQATTTTRGIAYDHGVPRFRPHTIIGESGLDAAGAQRRADWQARHNLARGTSISVDVKGFRQPNGKLWRINQLCPVKSPWLQIDTELLIAAVSYEKDTRGSITRMTLGPVDGYQPDPGQVKVQKGKGTAPVYATAIKPIPPGER